MLVGTQRLAAPGQLTGFAGRPVSVGIRAENINVSDTARDGALAAQVEVVEPTGSAVLLTVQLDGIQLKVQTPPSFATQPGKPVWLTIDPKHMRFYDPDTALALEVAA